MLLTICGYLLLGDWQAIPYDPCTAYSPFHHPEMLTNNNRSSNNENFTKVELLWDSQSLINDKRGKQLSTSSIFCTQVEKCLKTMETDIIYLRFGTVGQLLPYKHSDDRGSLKTLYCSHPIFSNTSICVTIANEVYEPILTVRKHIFAQIESLQVLPNDTYWKSRSICMNANVTGHKCHWIPSSLVAKKECEDCPPICRSLSQTLNFAQFLLGLGLLLFSNSLLWVSLITLLFNQLPSERQVCKTALHQY